MNNKEVLKHCTNFNKISNFEYNERDIISERLITIYREYIFGVDLNDSEQVNNIEKLDSIINKYIDDYYFRKEMRLGLQEMKIKKNENVILEVVRRVLNIFNQYEEEFTKKIYISRWI